MIKYRWSSHLQGTGKPIGNMRGYKPLCQKKTTPIGSRFEGGKARKNTWILLIMIHPNIFGWPSKRSQKYIWTSVFQIQQSNGYHNREAHTCCGAERSTILPLKYIFFLGAFLGPKKIIGVWEVGKSGPTGYTFGGGKKRYLFPVDCLWKRQYFVT